MTSFLVSLITFCALGVAAMSIYVALYGSHRILEERFAELAVKMRVAHGDFAEDSDVEPATLGRALFRWAATRVPVPKADTPAGEKLSQMLVQAGYISSTTPQKFQVLRFAIGIGGALVGLILALVTGSPFGRYVIFMILGGVVGFFVPTYLLARRARLRQWAIARQLSDVLDLLVVCVEAGLGLFEAIRVVGREAQRQKQEIGTELSLVAGEISAGASLGQALRNLAERTAVEDIKPLAATLIQSELLGAQIGPALHASSDALRTRRRLRAEEAAQKSTIKILFPLVFFVLPAMIMVIIGPAIIQIIRTLSTH
jgi:tight adherence protein C